MKIEIEHVSKKIKDALVLDDVCMTLESGNIYGFKGVNGSGKTMLMRAVSGLMYPTSGTISIHDKRKYRKYSLGMKQRLGIACAIMEEPKLLLLDEPFNALDKEGQEKLSEIIRDMRDKGSLILLSSHDKDELENLSDVIYLVDSGRFKLK